MDIVYPLKRSAGPDDELRYSLRSLQNLPHGRVFLVGGRPAWAKNVEHIGTDRKHTKYKDAGNNIVAACRSREVSDPFILMNDDFFVMEPIREVPVLNRGKVRDVLRLYETRIGFSKYIAGMRNTLDQLADYGYDDPLSFELHVPIVIHKDTYMQTRELRTRVDTWHIRTAYGAVMGLEGTTIRDVKVNEAFESVRPGPFASTSDRSFRQGMAGFQVRSKFRRPSPYEVA